MKKVKLSAVSTLHYIRLVYRSILFLLLLIGYISYRLRGSDAITSRLEKQPVIIVVTWSVFVLEMVLRFFPSRFESPGCQKQFGRNYIKSGETNIIIHDNNATLLTALIWIVLNGFIGALLIRWEVTFYLHPERFSENTNEYLRCRNCSEKLCSHKKQLRTLWKDIEVYTAKRIKMLKK